MHAGFQGEIKPHGVIDREAPILRKQREEGEMHFGGGGLDSRGIRLYTQTIEKGFQGDPAGEVKNRLLAHQNERSRHREVQYQHFHRCEESSEGDEARG